MDEVAGASGEPRGHTMSAMRLVVQWSSMVGGWSVMFSGCRSGHFCLSAS